MRLASKVATTLEPAGDAALPHQRSNHGQSAPPACVTAPLLAWPTWAAYLARRPALWRGGSGRQAARRGGGFPSPGGRGRPPPAPPRRAMFTTPPPPGGRAP